MVILGFRERKAERLAKRGYQQLEAGEPEAALGTAAELERLRYSAAFEIAALAQAQLGNLEASVAMLERGLGLAPDVWLNWQLLGNDLSDLGRYEQAGAAYEKALTCPQVDESSIRLNQSIAASRRGNHAEALAYADQVTDPSLQLRASSARVTALCGLERFGEATDEGEARLSVLPDQDSQEAGWLAAALGRAKLRAGASREEVVEQAIHSLERFGGRHPGLLALIREADDRSSETARCFRVTIDARIPSTEPLSQQARGYVVRYTVAADTLEEALQFVGRLESASMRCQLHVDEHSVLEEGPRDRKGVYERGERYFYASED
jgi:tetratricopeptide (TPR) repeat protein